MASAPSSRMKRIDEPSMPYCWVSKARPAAILKHGTHKDVAMKKSNLRNRANDRDRPKEPKDLREVPLSSIGGRACKEAGGHDHVFIPYDRYGCCTRCGDEVLV